MQISPVVTISNTEAQVHQKKSSIPAKVVKAKRFSLDRAHTISSPSNHRTVRRTPVMRRSSTQFLKAGFSVVLFCASFSLIASFLTSINTSTSTGYQIGKLKKDITDKADSLKDIQRSVSERTALSSLDQDLKSQGFVQVSDVRYEDNQNKTVSKR